MHRTGQEHSLDWATAPVKVVMDRSFGSQDTTAKADDDAPNIPTDLGNLERETGFEPATLSLGM